MATKLSIFNGALQLCEERRLRDLKEKREPRYFLDEVWDNGGVKSCLEEADWNFALRTVKFQYDPGFEPDFGFQRAFRKPDDWVRTEQVAPDEYMTLAYKDNQFADEGDYWYADIDELYVRFVSNDPDYGENLARWPESFARYVEAYFAYRIVGRLSKAVSFKEYVEREMKDRRRSATAKDAMNQGVSLWQEGAWNRHRRGSRRRGDGGNNNSLYG